MKALTVFENDKFGSVRSMVDKCPEEIEETYKMES